MSVHIGEVTSEVTATTAEPYPSPEPAPSVWHERARTEAMLERIARDRLRTATGDD
ncbi:hypothetical protein [Actinoplanes sp. M2I2]|uniref:hypothetical protein n=1 Tax=Actinoplanes sp. M2I2 TaxID=1734444 RepID=UPI002020AD42|nr:hypothetical protein [Actinoplanes sp. M2I2]